MALINLNKKLNKIDQTKKKKSAKKLLVIGFILLVFIVIPIFVGIASSYAAYKSSQKLSQGLKEENFEIIKTGVSDTKTAVNNLNYALTPFLYLKLIPFLGGYYADVKHFVQALSFELSAVEKILAILEPDKMEIGFTGSPTPGQDKITQAVKILNKILPSLDQIEPDLKKGREEVKNIDLGKYPQKIGSKNLKGRVEEAKNFIIGVHIAVSEAKDALRIAPQALGAESAKNYLVLFQNDKEIRATGGFLTAYAFLRLDNGHLSTTASDDIYRLDEKLLKVCLKKICPLAPPSPIVKYLPEVSGKSRSAWSMRDSNLSPDLPTSAQEFERMYELLGEGIPFEGIIYIDTQVVEELIKITGPVDVFGTVYSAEQDKRCNCPNVIYELEHYAEVAAKGEMERKAILGTLMQQILAKILGSGMDKLPTFINSAIQLANEKHILIYMRDQQSQEALNSLNWTGQIKIREGDYLHINDSNFAGGKSNLYVEEKVTYEIKVEKDGSVKNKVTIEYKNSQSFTTWLNGILRDYVRIYVPKGSQLVSSKGSEDQVSTVDDEKLGKTYFEAFIQVRPQNSQTLSFEYTLPNKITGKIYPLLIQKQPGAKDHHYVIKINGSKKADFNLLSDKQVNLSF